MVEFIKYKKEKLPVRVSYYALSEYKNETGEELDNSVEWNKTILKLERWSNWHQIIIWIHLYTMMGEK